MMRDRTPQVPNISDSKRVAILNWLVNINGSIGNPAVVQTAAWYLDALLSVTELNINKWQVVGVACYWIAMKIHGKSYSLKALVTIGGDAYSAKVLKFTERLVLRTLEFPIQPVVAQDFISYLSWECDATNYADIETAATMFYMAVLVLQKSLKLYPTALAAVAAIRNALNMLHKQELLEKLANNAVF
ncbi:G2/mitotic-specific cyclin-A-like [Maniola hyperantus]|uniref:G2/mitotic-specific cyclin-A-like n=1 Tax=Aphantopus hyperantus TaxID=2795564 RepID=UPI002124121D